MPVRAWAAAGLVVLGLSVAIVSGLPAFRFTLGGQTILAAPYVVFALLAGLSPSPKPALLLSGLCLVLQLALLQQASALLEKPGASLGVLGWFYGLGVIGPGLLALVALVMLALRRGDRLREEAARERS